MIDYEVVQLRTLLNENNDINKTILGNFYAFRCSRNPGIERFVREKVIVRAEQSNDSRTFLLVAKDKSNWLQILGFFTLAISSIAVKDKMPDIKTIMEKDKPFRPTGNYAVYLLGQFTRNDRFNDQDLPGHIMMDEVMSVISKASKMVGGRGIILDAFPQVFDKVYKQYNFIPCSEIKPNKLTQYLLKLSN